MWSFFFFSLLPIVEYWPLTNLIFKFERIVYITSFNSIIIADNMKKKTYHENERNS